MSDFPTLTGSALIRALKKFGFEVIRIKGSHHFLKHSVHSGETIGIMIQPYFEDILVCFRIQLINFVQ